MKDNLYLSYRRSSKSGKKNIVNSSKTRLLKEGSSMNTDDTYEFKITEANSSQQVPTQESMCIKNIPQNYEIKKISNLNYSKNKEGEASCTIDSARNSEISSSYSTGFVKEFMEAAKQGNKEKLSYIMDSAQTFNVNLTDSKLNTALHYAVNEGKYRAANFLLERGIDANLKNKDNMETALHIAWRKGYK